MVLEDAYKHMGGMVAGDGAMTRELVHRKRAQAQSVAPLRRTAFRSKRIAARSKVIFLDAISTSQLLYNAHTWGRLSATQRQSLQSALALAYRSALRLRNGPRADHHIDAGSGGREEDAHHGGTKCGGSARTGAG